MNTHRGGCGISAAEGNACANPTSDQRRGCSADRLLREGQSRDPGGPGRGGARRRGGSRCCGRRGEGCISRAGRAAPGGRAGRSAAQARRSDRRNVPEIARTETQDTGQPIAQTAKQLVPRSADNFHYFAEMCVRVDGHTYPTPTHLNYTLFHPVGVCALISPWNVPFMTSTWKVAPALAFGNTAVLKMSELSPLTASRLGELALEAGIPAGRAQCRARLRRRGRRAAVPRIPTCARSPSRVHRHRQPHRQGGGT